MEPFLTVPIESLAITLAASIFGFVAHVLLKVGELRENDATVTLAKYFARNPYRTVSKLLVVMGSVVMLAEPQITPMVLAGAAGIGYAADSAANKFGGAK